VAALTHTEKQPGGRTRIRWSDYTEPSPGSLQKGSFTFVQGAWHSENLP